MSHEYAEQILRIDYADDLDQAVFTGITKYSQVKQRTFRNVYDAIFNYLTGLHLSRNLSIALKVAIRLPS
jgi:hypothetical protein